MLRYVGFQGGYGFGQGWFQVRRDVFQDRFRIWVFLVVCWSSFIEVVVRQEQVSGLGGGRGCFWGGRGVGQGGVLGIGFYFRIELFGQLGERDVDRISCFDYGVLGLVFYVCGLERVGIMRGFQALCCFFRRFVFQILVATA